MGGPIARRILGKIPGSLALGGLTGVVVMVLTSSLVIARCWPRWGPCSSRCCRPPSVPGPRSAGAAAADWAREWAPAARAAGAAAWIGGGGGGGGGCGAAVVVGSGGGGDFGGGGASGDW